MMATTGWRIDVQRVRRASRNWGIYVIDLATGQAELLEGGFFDRGAAELASVAWERELVNDEVEKAERAAGWPRPCTVSK